MLTKMLSTSNDISLTVQRVVLGAVFFAHGAQKMLGWYGGHGFEATMDAFVQSGMPAVLAFLVIAAEFFGGLGLLAGLLTRVAAFGIAAVMAGAILLVHAQFGFFMNWGGSQRGEGYEYHLLAMAMAVTLMIRGAGALSLDRWVVRNAVSKSGQAGHGAVLAHR